MEVPEADRYESLPERLIREAIEAGAFDDLPGEGEPIPGAGTPDDELWWTRAWLKRNGIGPHRGAHPEADPVRTDDRSR
jgi:hypothetical protein